jgi:hypothetical protein
VRWATIDSLIQPKVRSATRDSFIQPKVRSATGDSFIQARDAIGHLGFLHPDRGRVGLTEDSLQTQGAIGHLEFPHSDQQTRVVMANRKVQWEQGVVEESPGKIDESLVENSGELGQLGGLGGEVQAGEILGQLWGRWVRVQVGEYWGNFGGGG